MTMREFHRLLRDPLFRLLLINLGSGAAVAVMLLGGLMALNPFGLRDLILSDSSPATALGLLLLGFLVTFGSTAMGTAIMALGRPPVPHEPGPDGNAEPVPLRVRAER